MPATVNTMPTAAQMSCARDQFLRFSLVSAENPHTQYITMRNMGTFVTSSMRK